MAKENLKEELIAFAQQVAEWVALQKRTDELGVVYRLRPTPMVRGSATAQSVTSRADTHEVMNVGFGDGTRVVVGAGKHTGFLTMCILLSRQCTLEHGNWEEVSGSELMSFAFPATELGRFQKEFQEHMAKHGQKEGA